MKAISLWQPWATLVATGAKRHETRSWETLYRGPIAIHAAKRWTSELKNIRSSDPFVANLPAGPLPFGAIIAVARLVNCVRIDNDTTPTDAVEVVFGDYTHGRFRWDFDNVVLLDKPILFRGAQGLFDVPLIANPQEAKREA